MLKIPGKARRTKGSFAGKYNGKAGGDSLPWERKYHGA